MTYLMNSRQERPARSKSNRKMKVRTWAIRACGLSLLWAATVIASPAQTFTLLHNFDGTDGANAETPLVQGPDGNLHGTTFNGGASDYGTVFKTTLAGALTSVYSFCTQINCSDGSSPKAGLIVATDGNLYGTTSTGGLDTFGTAFKINATTGSHTIIYDFCSRSGCADGEFPNALIQATDGNFYGTTTFANDGGPGTVFKLTPDGALTTLHNFCVQPCSDGTNPETGLVQASDGDFFGTSYNGGGCNAGAVFEITPGAVETPLYSFCYTDGTLPSGLFQGSGGEFFGTSQLYGLNNGGTAFKITSGGALTALYNFCSQPDCADGSQPVGGVIQATDGNFYGTTFSGGANGLGTIFQMTPTGTLTTLHSFASTDGANPTAGLFQATNGVFYGVTDGGGANGDGVVFSLDMGLGPFVETVPTSGMVGSGVRILGTNLTGVTSVTFNGVPATFTVVSPSYIRATVPAGATTGSVQVTTSSGVLSSNVVFRVRP